MYCISTSLIKAYILNLYMYDLEFIMYILLLSPTPFLYAHTHEYIVPAAARLGPLC